MPKHVLVDPNALRITVSLDCLRTLNAIGLHLSVQPISHTFKSRPGDDEALLQLHVANADYFLSWVQCSFPSRSTVYRKFENVSLMNSIRKEGSSVIMPNIGLNQEINEHDHEHFLSSDGFGFDLPWRLEQA